jgi:hypothetical protein
MLLLLLLPLLLLLLLPLLLLLLLPLLLLLLLPGVKGCNPGPARKPGGAPRTCVPFDGVTEFGAGMIALSVISAVDNNIGLLGMVPNANAYM